MTDTTRNDTARSDAARHDVWTEGEAYERYVGRWSRPVAEHFLDALAVPPGAAWLDIGCGTGALTRCILERHAPRQVVGIDPSDGFIGYARAQLRDHPQAGRADVRIGDARALPVDDGAFDVAVSGLVLNFIPDQPKALGEMRRAVRPGGCIAAYVWDYAGGMQMMRRFWDAASALDPQARAHDEALRFASCRPDPLRALFANAGLRDITVAAIDVPTLFRDFNDYWSPFLGGQGPAPAYCMALPQDRREHLRERIRADLPVNSDGSIPLTARAWMVRGVV